MFSFLKRGLKKSRREEPIYYVGKSPVDPEFIHIGDDDEILAQLTSYVQLLHDEMLQNHLYDKTTKNASLYFFLDWNKASNTLELGRLGQTRDRSERHYICIFLREVLDETIKKYPLFLASLYTDFLKESEQIVSQNIKTLTLDLFEKKVRSQKHSSIYDDDKQVLTASMEGLYALSIDTYLNELKPNYPLMTKEGLMASWAQWRESVCLENKKDAFLPLLMELPLGDNLHHYVSFVCQIVEPLFEGLMHYRIFWWRDEIEKKAWCYVVTFKREADLDIILFDRDKISRSITLSYDTSGTLTFPKVSSLFDALQFVSGLHNLTTN